MVVATAVSAAVSMGSGRVERQVSREEARKTGRGERSRADTFQLIVRIDRGNVQGGLRRAAEIA